MPLPIFIEAITGVKDAHGNMVSYVGAHYAMLAKNSDGYIYGYNNNSYYNKLFSSIYDYMNSDSSCYSICLAGYYAL